MRYFALACDYDGTIAYDGRVDDATIVALKRLLATGRRLILVSGRELPDLLATFAHTDLFDWLVLENGGLLYRPATKEEKPLAPPPPDNFLALLRKRSVAPLSVGRVIVATWKPHELAVLESIRDLGLELHVIFNKGAVMILPANVNKATGLLAALGELGLSAHNVVAVGDAENDHAFLRLCECSVAVANALPSVKDNADFVTRADHGAGVVELIDELIADDLARREGRLLRHHLLLGHRTDDNAEVALRPFGSSVLIAGPSGSGKSTVAAAFLERLADQGYQFCIIDPEGDYEKLEGAIVLGDHKRAPGPDEALRLLEQAGHNAVINLVGMAITDRPNFFLTLLPRLQELRARTGRPHWLLIDEAHHLLPSSWEPGAQALPQGLDGVALITVHPGQVHPAILTGVDTVIAVGPGPGATLAEFCEAMKIATPATAPGDPETGEVTVWSRAGGAPARVRIVPGKAEHRRHVRKYAEEALPPDRSFYFRGPESKLNLRAQNLILFVQMADGVDDATWEFHRNQGDYSRWFRDCIKNEELAAEAERVEKLDGLPPRESRELIRAAIERHYTLPAAPTLPMPGTDAEGGRA